MKVDHFRTTEIQCFLYNLLPTYTSRVEVWRFTNISYYIRLPIYQHRQKCDQIKPLCR